MSRMIFESVNDQLTNEAGRRINVLLNDPKGVPDGKNKRTKLTLDQRELLKSKLIDAIGHASVHAANGPLPNRVPGRGRPPDNAVFIFIDDIWRACETVGVKP